MANIEYYRTRTTNPPPHVERPTNMENGDSDTHESAGQHKTSTSG